MGSVLEYNIKHSADSIAAFLFSCITASHSSGMLCFNPSLPGLQRSGCVSREHVSLEQRAQRDAGPVVSNVTPHISSAQRPGVEGLQEILSSCFTCFCLGDHFAIPMLPSYDTGVKAFCVQLLVTEQCCNSQVPPSA